MINITNQRDRDSLEFSLVATVAELMPVNSISLFRIYGGSESQEIEKIIHLVTEPSENEGLMYLWDKEPKVVGMQQEFVQCLKNNESCSFQVNGNSTRLLLPITHDDSAEGVLEIITEHALKEYQYAIEGLVKIYENYLTVLHESEFDTLTGLRNRRTFDKKIDRFLDEQRTNVNGENDNFANNRRSCNTAKNAWLAVLDIDHFKKINDNYGHIYGDEVLLLLAQQMKKSFRRKDILFRFGGEEFVVILEPTTAEMAGMVLERFRQNIEHFDFPQVGQVTLSIGYAQIGEHDFPLAIIENADKALYYAKSHGRNCVHYYDDLVTKGLLKTAKINDDVELF